MAKLVMTHQIFYIVVRLQMAIADRLMFISTPPRKRRNLNNFNEKLREKFNK